MSALSSCQCRQLGLQLFSRLFHVQLGRKGVGTDEEKESIDDPEFLMDVMEAREEVDDLEDAEALQGLKSQYLSKQSGIIQVFMPCPIHSRSACGSTQQKSTTMVMYHKWSSG